MNTASSNILPKRGCIATDTQLTAVKRCDFYRIPFILYAMPGEEEATFFADAYETELLVPTMRRAIITEFDESLRRDANRIVINAFYNAEHIANSTKLFKARHSDYAPSPVSTSAISYMARIHEVAAALGRGPEKAVIARIISGTTIERVEKIAENLFSGVTKTMRFMFYTPQTGLWMGSTPELLLSTRHTEGGPQSIRTIALAGTLPADFTEPWDDKNIREQQIVARVVHETVVKSGASDIEITSGEKTHGPVKHLCTEITAKLPADADPEKLEEALHPTPAVLGFPADKAAQLIDRYENINRRCYSGLLTVVDEIEPDRPRDTYVMLRCAMLGERDADGSRKFNIYSGGGILHSSKPEAEWDETARKALPMQHVITGTPIEELPVTSLFEQIDIEQTDTDPNTEN